MRESPFANDRGLPPPTLDTATFRVGVLAVGMSIRVPRGIAGSTGISNFFLAFRTMTSNSSTSAGGMS